MGLAKTRDQSLRKSGCLCHVKSKGFSHYRIKDEAMGRAAELAQASFSSKEIEVKLWAGNGFSQVTSKGKRDYSVMISANA